MISAAILALSTVLQLVAAALAVRLVFRSGRYLAWTLIAVALLLMATRRVISLHALVDVYLASGSWPVRPGAEAAEIVALFISAAMLAGVMLIAPLFQERETATAALRETEAKFEGILEHSTDVFMRSDASGRIDLVSNSVRDLVGCSPDELIGRKVADLHADPHGREVFLEALRAGGGRLRNYEADLLHRDGSIVRVSTSTTRVIDEEGNFAGIQGIVRNITEERRAEQLNARLGRILEASINEVYVYDSQTLRFLMVNRAALDNLGWTMEEMTRLTPVDVKPLFTFETYSAAIQPLRDGTREMHEFETRQIRKDGSTYDVRVRLQLVQTETPPVFFAIVEDKTEHRRTEEILRQAQKMEAVGQLTAGVAHDFNNLLMIVLGNLDILENELTLTSNQKAFLDNIARAANRGADLTKGLLAFARKQPLVPEPINAAKIVTDMSELLRKTLGEAIAIETVFDSGLWICEADLGQFQNALMNLCINARDAMPDGGKLTVEAGNARIDDEYAAARIEVEPGQYVRISVSDTGIGIPPEIRDRLFEPFFTTKADGRGTGLGLSMVYGFVKQSRGHISLYSEIGAGTTFNIYLPRTFAGTDRAPALPHPADLVGNGETVFVVEDDTDLRILTVKMLHSLGYTVREAPTGPAALEQFAQDPGVNLLLTDVMLPGGMTGRELADQITREHPAVKVLYMSGYTENAIIHHGRLDPGIELMQKPFRQAELGRKVRKLLDAESRKP